MHYYLLAVSIEISALLVRRRGQRHGFIVYNSYKSPSLQPATGLFLFRFRFFNKPAAPTTCYIFYLRLTT